MVSKKTSACLLIPSGDPDRCISDRGLGLRITEILLVFLMTTFSIDIVLKMEINGLGLKNSFKNRLKIL